METTSRPAHDAFALRSAFGHFATGVTVVTYEFDGAPYGATVSSYTSVSMDPALLLVSFQRSSRAGERLAGRPFAVNVLSQEQHATALHFAGRPQEDHVVEWERAGGAPRFADGLAWFTCRPWRSYDGGDHVLFLGEIEDFGVAAGVEPLLFYRGALGAPRPA